MRILLDNKIKPIVLIAFTNHALDHMLNSILDAKITKKFVRFGFQSTDERISQYSLWHLEKTSDNASMSGQIKRAYAIKKKTEEDMYKVMDDIQIPEPSEDQIKEYLQTNWGEHLSVMYNPPFWIAEYADRLWASEDEEGEWVVQGKGKGKGKKQSHLMAHTYYGLWKRGLDITFIQPPQSRYIEAIPQKTAKKQRSQNTQPNVVQVPPTEEELDKYKARMFKFFSELGFGDAIPPIPTGDRQFVQLQDSSAVWGMSFEERQQLAKYWEEEMRQLAYDNYLEKYRELRRQYEEACERHEAITDEVGSSLSPDIIPLRFPKRRRRLLEDIDLIGCTTTG